MLRPAVPEVVVHRSVTDGELRQLLQPRHDVVVEQPSGEGRFALGEGPFRHWERSVEVTSAPAGESGRHEVVERVRFRLALPVWGFLYTPLVKRSIRRPPSSPEKRPWWSPPDLLDARATNAIGLLCVFSLFAGYLGTLLTQTNTFFKEDFGVSDGDIAWAGAAVRVAALLALFVVALADRRGRRAVLLGSTVLAIAFTAAGAFAPGLVWLGVSQTLARAFSTTMAILVSIIAVEETPKGSRAFAVSVLTMTGALGAGLCVMLLRVAQIDTWTWRVLFLVPALGLLALPSLRRGLPESQRFTAREARVESAQDPASTVDATVKSQIDRGRLLLLAMTALFLALFVTPASFFLNEYLRTERDFSALNITFFQILTNTPGGLGIVVGGMLADARGRRVIGAIGLGAGVGFTVLMYLGTGWEIWIWSLLGAVIGAMAVPALGVYGPELFPTGSRGKANGVISLFGVVGSAVGLVAAGQLADRLAGGLPHAMALLAIGPAIVVVLVLVLYPETAARELEELNPEDAPITRELLALEGLDTDTIPERYPPRHGGDPDAE